MACKLHNPIVEAARRSLQDQMKAASVVLQQFPSGPMGLTPDDVKASPEFQAAKRAYAASFAALRAFNTRHKP